MGMTLNLFNTCREAAAALAASVAADLQQALAASARDARALLLVSGGRSPLPFFSALASQPLDWRRLDVSPVDERCVPLGHADSNAALIGRNLLQGPAHAARLLPLMAPPHPGEPAWNWALRSADAACADAALVHPAAIVLGLGTDGHTASLFRDAPQWDEAAATGRRYVALTPSQAPHARVSLSLAALIAQRNCYVWSSGPEKLAVIRHAEVLMAAAPNQRPAISGASAFALLAMHPAIRLQVFHCT